MMKKVIFSLILTGSIFAGTMQLMATTFAPCEVKCEVHYVSCLGSGTSESTCFSRYSACLNSCP